MSIRQQFNQPNSGQRLNNIVKHFRVVEGCNESELFTKESESILGPHMENITIDRNTIHRLSCHHIAIGIQDISGYCMRCKTHFCRQCAVPPCSRCRDILCSRCMKTWQGEPFCRTCKLIKMFTTFMQHLHQMCLEKK